MSEKRPSELLRETLQKSADEVAKWPQWMRDAMSTASIFQFTPQQIEHARGHLALEGDTEQAR